MVLTDDEREMRELSDALYRAFTSLPYMPGYARKAEEICQVRARRIARDKRISEYGNAKPS